MNPRILLDMDGVITDFIGGALRAHGLHYEEVIHSWPATEWDIVKALGMSNEEFWGPIDNHKFWASLEPYWWFDELLYKIEEVGPFTISTTPSQSVWSSSGKVEWLQKRFGVKFKEYMLGGSKHLMAKGDKILLDDSDRNVADFREAGGYAILFPQHWNSNYELIPVRLEYVLNCLEEAKYAKL